MRWDARRYESSFGPRSTHLPRARVNGLSISAAAQMIADARVDHPDLSFELADGHDFSVAEQQDAVFSNAALHWMSRDPDAVIARVHAALVPGGRFVAEFGAAGNRPGAARHGPGGAAPPWPSVRAPGPQLSPTAAAGAPFARFPPCSPLDASHS